MFGRLLLALEGVWALLWVVWMFVFHFLEGTNFEFRSALFFLAFHAANASAVYSTWNRVNQKNKGVAFIAYLMTGFALATDLSSLLECVLHLSAFGGTLYSMFLALAVIGLVISALSLAWLIYLSCTVQSYTDESGARRVRRNVRF